MLTGNESEQTNQYFLDETSTCDAGITPSGCATTFLEAKNPGAGTSMAGTGPYVISSVDLETNDIVLQANPNYWGGPYQYMGGAKVVPEIKTIDYNYAPSLSTES